MNQDCGGNFKLTADNTTYIKDDCDQCVKYEYKKTKRELISVQVRHINAILVKVVRIWSFGIVGYN